MFRIIFPNTWYVDHHGTPCKILRSTHNKVHYIRKGRTCIASMFRFNHCVFRSIRSRIGIEVRSAIRIHSINRELNFFYRFLTRFFAAFHYRGIFPQ
ncbi:DUF4222 domain-containing protein [Escherichia coli]|uniref:DUF4222 domain-containing protein n=1 Tax=Escherichia coli TaxID=562 RepID=UPI000DA429B1|nr:DUF4222 domain-containing protein [Escherichia coli]SQK58454.1 bacteriophage protein [Escherichia coli]